MCIDCETENVQFSCVLRARQESTKQGTVLNLGNSEWKEKGANWSIGQILRPPAARGGAERGTNCGINIYSARTELLYVKSRYIGPLIPISFSYLKPFLLDSYLG